jgi:pimeloyl-ACP methyl ester carboxylesterase
VDGTPGELTLATREGLTLAAKLTGAGTPVVLLHGLTATHRYVVMGSHTLQRSGHRVLAYDARGHGRSEAPEDLSAFGYELLAQDLEDALDAAGIGQALIAGVSMGAHTAARLALHAPERVLALGLITPGYDPAHRDGAELERWDALAEGLTQGGVEGFLDAYELSAVPRAWRQTLAKAIRQRLSQHTRLDAVAAALRVVPRSRPFESLDELASITAPTIVIATRDEADPMHPLALAERYARAIPQAQLHCEQPGASPLAWQGGRVSSLLARLAARRHT